MIPRTDEPITDVRANKTQCHNVGNLSHSNMILYNQHHTPQLTKLNPIHFSKYIPSLCFLGGFIASIMLLIINPGRTKTAV